MEEGPAAQMQPGVTYWLVPSDLMERITEVLREQPYKDVARIVEDLKRVPLTRRDE